MYRVELKVQFGYECVIARFDVVPNVPRGVESQIFLLCLGGGSKGS